MLHRQHDLGEQFAGMGGDDRRAEDPVLARRDQQLDEAAIGALGDRAVEMGEVVADDLERHPGGGRARLVMADMGDFGIGEGRPRAGRDNRRWKRRNPPNKALTAAYQAWCAATWVNW